MQVYCRCVLCEYRKYVLLRVLYVCVYVCASECSVGRLRCVRIYRCFFIKYLNYLRGKLFSSQSECSKGIDVLSLLVKYNLPVVFTVLQSY